MVRVKEGAHGNACYSGYQRQQRTTPKTQPLQKPHKIRCKSIFQKAKDWVRDEKRADGMRSGSASNMSTWRTLSLVLIQRFLYVYHLIYPLNKVVLN